MDKQKKVDFNHLFKLRCAVIFEGSPVELQQSLTDFQEMYGDRVNVVFAKMSADYLKITEEPRISDEPRPIVIEQ